MKLDEERLNLATEKIGRGCSSRILTSQDVLVLTLKEIATALDESSEAGDDADALRAIANRIDNAEVAS